MDNKKERTDEAELEKEVLDTTIIQNLDEWLAVSSLLQKPTYRVLISLGVNAGIYLTVQSLLDNEANFSLFNRLFLQPD